MTSVNDVKAKVQRILTSHGTVRLGKEGEFIIVNNSAVLWVEVAEGFGDAEVIIDFTVPMVSDVPLTSALYEWVATDGQNFRLGSTFVVKDDDDKTGSLFFSYAIIGDDLDESELMTSVFALLYTCDDLDNNLQKRFGGQLIGASSD